MFSKMRRKFVISFTYISVLAIGALIYLVVFLFAENRQNAMRTSGGEDFYPPNLSNSQNLSPNLSQNSQNLAQDFSQAPLDSVKSLDELPNEIDSAFNALDSTPNTAESVTTDLPKLPRNFIVEVKVLNVRAKPSVEGKILKRFKKGAVIRISEIQGQWAKLENGGFAFLSLLKDSAENAGDGTKNAGDSVKDGANQKGRN
ncbi:SH3 domain-containing protein [Helicobacter sp. 23-1044]